MAGTHSDWMFEHSLPDQMHPQIDVAPSIARFDHPAVVDHVDSVASTLQTLALWDHADLSHGVMKPTISIAQNALTVNAGGAVALPISVTPGNAQDATTVTIKGLAGYETITDNLDHQIFTGDTVTLTAAEVNSGLSLASNYTGSGHPVNTLVVTAHETNGSHTVSSAPQQIVVTDPPIAAGSSSGNTTTSSSTGDNNPLTLQVSGDMYNGDPQIQVYVDGHQVGGTYDITAHHSLGQTQTITIAGNFDPTVAHDVQVRFVNDLWDGSVSNADGHDRNVYVGSISLNGTTIQGENVVSNNASMGQGSLDPNAAVMLQDGTADYGVPADAPPNAAQTASGNPLTLHLSGDMYNGDPQIQVYVDGHQVGGTYDITAHHSLGETQTITIAGNFDPTVAHNVQVQFVNDLWDGNAPNADGHDRNVYVSSISLNGTTIQGENFASNNASLGEDGLDPSSAVMLVNGTASYNVPADPPLTLQVSGDMFNGAPQIEVFVDGHQVGGTISITAHHSLGQAQTITLPAEIDPTVPHQVQIQFINDSWDGSVPNTDGHDRNVYVSSVSLDSTTLHGNDFISNNASMGQDSLDPHAAVMLTNGTATYQIAADPPASGSSTDTSGSSVPQAPSGSTVGSNSGSAGTGAGAVPSGAGYYVSPNGSDSNPGTEAAPFATLARAQQAMENSSIKATYVEGGVYHMSNTLVLTGADNGETWQYYPANGVDSAVLDGGISVGQGIMADNTANITINGLTIRNFTTFGIEASAAINFTVENCDVSGTTAVGVTSGGITIGDNSANVTVANNYVHNTSEGGIEVYAFNPGSTLSNIVIANNVVIDTNKGVSDSGAIYTDMHGGFQANSTVIYIENNYVKDYGDPGAGFSNSQSHGIYLDDNTNHTYMSGNVIGPPTPGTAPTSTGLFVNSGHDNIFTGNIIDLGSNATAYAASWVTGGTSIYAGMSGNTFTNNIVVENYAGNIQTPDGHVFLTEVDGQAQPYIANNNYYNYGGGEAGSSGSRASDVNPSYVNPQMSGYLYTLSASSPVFGGAVSFPRIVGGWGPTGFVIPQTGATPSSMN